MPRPVLLMHSQHSLGLGHLVRSLALAAAFGERFRVVLLNGGRMPEGIEVPDGVELVQLPELRMNVGGALVSDRGDVEEVGVRRREIALAALESTRPQAIVVELFPFGRKKLAGELVPLLEAARDTAAAAPVRITSVRDILVRGRPDQQAFDDRAARLADELLDAVLVHGDPALATFEDSFRPSAALRVPLHHTGFVVPRREAREDVRPPQPAHVVVSAGGGRVGAPLLRAALGAQATLGAEGATMTLVGGPFLPDADLAELLSIADATPGARVERHVPDLVALLATAHASLSQCGYNTALDLARARIPSVVVPFVADVEDEQIRRARRLEELGLVHVVHPDAATPQVLARELRAAMAAPPPRPRLDLGGADRSVEIVAGLVARRMDSCRSVPTGAAR